MGERIDLPNARIEVEERPGYLYLVEHGTLKSTSEVDRYAAALELVSQRTGLRRALIDSRSQDAAEPSKALREAMWKWLLSGRAFEQIAFVLNTEMQVARVNMIALSQKAQIRAFPAVHEAHRWLSGRQRTHSITMTGLNTPVPPIERTTGEHRRTERPASATPPGIAAPRAPVPTPASPSTRNTGSFTALRPSGTMPRPPPDDIGGKVDKK